MCKGKEVLKSPRGPRETPRGKGIGSVGFQGEAGAGMLGPDCWSKSRFSLISNRCSQSRGVTQLYILVHFSWRHCQQQARGDWWQGGPLGRPPSLVCSMAGAD